MIVSSRAVGPLLLSLSVIGVACSSDATSSVEMADTSGDTRDAILQPPLFDSVTSETMRETSAPDSEVTSADTRPETATEPVDTDLPPIDTSVVDTAPDSLAEAVDATETDDASVPDTEASDAPDGAETAEPDPFAPGDLAYERIPNIQVVDDLRKVRWHPSGAFALILGTTNKILYYDAATRSLRSLGTLGASVAGIDVGVDGDFVMVGAEAGKSVLWRARIDAESGELVADPAISVPNGSARIVAVDPRSNPSRFVIGAVGSTDFIAHLYLYDATSGLSASKGINTSAGLWDLMWADPALTAGSAAVVTAEGINGAGSHTWVLDSDLVVGNGWSAGFGNAGNSHWRPNGTYGVVCGWSSNKVYIYDGAWTLGTLPVPTGAAPQAVRWRDARRALVVGRVIGSPPYAVVVELRAGDASAWTANFVDQSIRDFDESPWFGQTSSMHLLDVDWRPGTACDEGLIVGSDSGTSFNPSFGMAIRFHDSADPACSP